MPRGVEGKMELVSLIKIEAPRRHTFVPCTVSFNFAADIKSRGLSGAVDKNTVRITDADGGFVHCNLSDDFLYGDSGRIHFLVEDSSRAEYRLVYSLKTPGAPAPLPSYIGLVGNGDCLRYNQGTPQPFFNGMCTCPRLADIDGDGVSELVSPQAYSFTKGRQWHLVTCFKNQGTAQSPVWGDGVPLRCLKDGEVIQIRGATSIAFANVTGGERPDLLTSGYGGYGDTGQGSTIYVHRNTGKTDTNGLPLFEYAGGITLDTSFIGSFQYTDLDGSGQMGFLATHFNGTQTLNREDPLWFECTEEEKAAAGWPRWNMEYKLQFFPCAGKQPNGLPTAGAPAELLWNKGPVRAYNWVQVACLPQEDGGGVLYTHSTSDYSNYGANLRSTLVHLRYAGRRGEGGSYEMETARVYSDITCRPNMMLSWAACETYHGLLLTHQLGGRCVYRPAAGPDENGAPVFGPPEDVLQANPYVNASGGFASGALVDLDGDGDFDIITGSENGYSALIENSGTRRLPRFKQPQHLQCGGEPVFMLNGPFDDPRALSEACCGQTSPFYLDANFDGVPDVVIKVGRRTYLFENAGTQSEPVLKPPRELRTENGATLGMHRNRPAIGCFTGSGCPDVICDSPDGMKRLNLYRGFRDEEGRLCFRDAEALRYDDGSLIVPIEWHRYTKFWNVADYFGNGKNDLVLSTCNLVLALENVGTNENPVYKRPVEIRDADGSVFEIGHHISMPVVVDWDGAGHRDLVIFGESGMMYLLRQNYLNGAGSKIMCTVVPAE